MSWQNFFLISIVMTALTVGCETRIQKAERLLSEGKYAEVISEYPDLHASKTAKNKIADSLLSAGRYKEILLHYSTTESAWPAAEGYANLLLKEGMYEKIISDFSRTAASKSARDSLAEGLYRDRHYRDVLLKYPDSPAATKVDKHHPKVRQKMKREEERRKAEAEKARRIAEKKRKKAEAEKLRRCKRSPSVCLSIGMRAYEVRNLIGYPDDINKTTFGALGRQYVHEQWVYEFEGYYTYDAVYLYFEDGILTSWQE